MSYYTFPQSFAGPRPRRQPPPGPQPHASQEFLDNGGLDDIHLSTADTDTSLLSPFNLSSQTTSNSTSPPYQHSGTPAEDISDYSNYQPSEQYSDFTDEFFGVNFDIGVHRIDSLPSSLTNGFPAQPIETNKPLPDLPPLTQPDPSPRHLAISNFPPSPVPSTSPSPIQNANGARTKATATTSQREVTTDLHTLRIPKISAFVTTQSSSLQLTPDHSGSSHTSGEGFEPSIMAQADLNQSPHVTVSQWEFQQSPAEIGHFMQNEAHYPNLTNTSGNQDLPQEPAESLQAEIPRDEEGQWRPNELTGQAGWDPESRKLLSPEIIPNLKEQEASRRVERRNSDIEDWRSHTGPAESTEEVQDPSYFTFRQAPADQSSIAPVDDAASIRNNRLLEGQTYYNIRDDAPTPPTRDDLHLMGQPRQFNDAPALPYTTDTKNLPATANDAIRQWNGNADTFSLSSRSATWGTRRKSEPSLKDYESIVDGSFLKKLSISKPSSRQNSLFDQGLDRLASIVRKKSDSKLKRARSAQNVPEELEGSSQPRHNSQSSLLSLPRTPSFGRRPTPSINTALAAMTGPLAAVGTTHARSGSVSGHATSPKSPSHLGFASRVIQRARSRSELTSHDRSATPSLVGLLRGHGGPPVANLATGSEMETKPKSDTLEDDEDDEDDDQGEEGEMRAESEANADPIIPNYEGFKAHISRLNPEMDTRHHWLVSRIAHQQEIRYKNLLEMRIKHSKAIQTGSCPAGPHCIASGGSAKLLDPKGKPRGSESSGLHYGADASDDSNPGEGALTDETFPSGVPMPPTRNLPAEFECQLCFKTKKFQKPSDWTKHVHEDVQPFTCTYEKCKEPKSFKRKADWVRHENERHRHLEWWVCQMDDCRHPCYRKDNFLQHLVREHKLPEPKQKTKAAIKKARTTEIAWIMLERCHHDTENKPQDEPCKFCGKSFATWKKLTVHLAKHMEHISLPVLRLVDQRKVDADTVISPIEQNMTPITPVEHTKFESTSPMGATSQSTSILPQFSGYDQPSFFSTTTGPSPTYRLQAPMPQDFYDQNLMFATPYGSAPTMGQPRAFGSTDSSNLSQMDHSRPFGSMDSNYSQTPSHSYSVQQQAEYPVQQQYTSGPPAASGYQSSNILGMSDTAYGFTHVGADGGHEYQQMQMSRSAGSTSPYGTGHSPHNVHYYNQ